MTRQTILLCGAGGHARSCIDVIEQDGRYTVIGIIGKAEEVGSLILGYKVLGTDQDLPRLIHETSHALITVGQIKTPEPRLRLYKLLKKSGYDLPVIISPMSYVSRHAQVGEGTIVFHGASINAGATIGENCIINTQALVEHDVVINKHCHISTGAIINGTANIGAATFIGSGSVIREGVKIGEHSVIGMGQHVFVDCEAETKLPIKKAY